MSSGKRIGRPPVPKLQYTVEFWIHAELDGARRSAPPKPLQMSMDKLPVTSNLRKRIVTRKFVRNLLKASLGTAFSDGTIGIQKLLGPADQECKFVLQVSSDKPEPPLATLDNWAQTLANARIAVGGSSRVATPAPGGKLKRTQVAANQDNAMLCEEVAAAATAHRSSPLAADRVRTLDVVFKVVEAPTQESVDAVRSFASRKAAGHADVAA